jgi:anti-sigma regulatory factor (Ser/Thr protein kinase)
MALGDRDSGARQWRVETLRLTLDPARLRAPDPLAELRAFVERQAPGERDAAIANTVVSELVVNAIDHGLLRLESSMRDEPGGVARYFAARATRLADLSDGTIAVEMGLKQSAAQRLLTIRVEDTGDGFVVPEPASMPGQNEEWAKHGRGLAIVRSFCRKAVWSDGGRVAEAEFLMEDKLEDKHDPRPDTC